jgi:hypothetical protein
MFADVAVPPADNPGARLAKSPSEESWSKADAVFRMQWEPMVQPGFTTALAITTVPGPIATPLAIVDEG